MTLQSCEIVFPLSVNTICIYTITPAHNFFLCGKAHMEECERLWRESRREQRRDLLQYDSPVQLRDENVFRQTYLDWGAHYSSWSWRATTTIWQLENHRGDAIRHIHMYSVFLHSRPDLYGGVPSTPSLEKGNCHHRIDYNLHRNLR